MPGRELRQRKCAWRASDRKDAGAPLVAEQRLCRPPGHDSKGRFVWQGVLEGLRKLAIVGKENRVDRAAFVNALKDVLTCA